MSRRIRLLLIMATALVVSIVSVSSASAALDYHFAVFEERTVGTYHGVTGTWDDPTFTGMNCAPPNSTNHMLVAMNLQAYGDHLEYAQIGFIQDKDSSCNTGYYYFWEHWTESLGDVQGVITSITPRGTGRKFGIDKDTTGAPAVRVLTGATTTTSTGQLVTPAVPTIPGGGAWWILELRSSVRITP